MAATLLMKKMRSGAETARTMLGFHLWRRGLKTAMRQQEVLPDLPYDYNALEPVISAEIMRLHHQKHHQAYVTGFNKAMEQLNSTSDPQTIVALQSAINFNGGGIPYAIRSCTGNMACIGVLICCALCRTCQSCNFWQNLAPPKEGGGEPPEGNLASAIGSEFGSLDKLIAKMSTTGAGVQGSGWVWLGLIKDMKRLTVETTANQDPLASKGLIPLLGIDVWEHAYYLQYKNVRPDYLKNIWKVVNWRDVAKRYDSA